MPALTAEQYRTKVSDAVKLLAHTLTVLGFDAEGVPDDELIEITTRRLRTLHAMLATSVAEGLLKAVMKEG